MNNVFVQCELWCEEILRRVARPCCTCSRHVSSQELEDLVPLGPRLHFEHGSSRAFVPGLQVSVGPCPSTSSSRAPPPPVCPGMRPEPGPCSNLNRFTHSYLMHEVQQNSPFMRSRHEPPSRLSPKSYHITRPSSATYVPPAFACVSRTATILSSPDQLEERLKSSLEGCHNISLQGDTHVSSSSDILQSSTSTSFSTCHSFGYSKERLERAILLQTLPLKAVRRDVDADSNVLTGVQKVLCGPNLDDVINSHSVVVKPSSLFSSPSCKSFINKKCMF